MPLALTAIRPASRAALFLLRQFFGRLRGQGEIEDRSGRNISFQTRRRAEHRDVSFGLLLGWHADFGERVAHGVIRLGRLYRIELDPLTDDIDGPLALSPRVVDAFDRRLEELDN